jgi:hypothetical protein
MLGKAVRSLFEHHAKFVICAPPFGKLRNITVAQGRV